MENIPPFIRWYAEKVGKDVTAFTFDDWRSLAFDAAAEIQALNRELSIIEKKLPPSPGKPGRKRKHPIRTVNYLCYLLDPEKYRYQERLRRGRHKQTYYGLPIEWYAYAIGEISKCPDAPRKRREILNTFLNALREKEGGYHDPQAVERSLRRLKKADTIQKKPA